MKVNYNLIQTRQELETLANLISQQDAVGLDFEAQGPPLGDFLNVSRMTVVGFSVAVRTEEGYGSWYVPLAHHKNNVPLLATTPVFAALSNHLNVWAHGWKFDLLCWELCTDIPLPALNDSMVLAWHHGKSASDFTGIYGLKQLSKKYLSVEQPTFKSLFGFQKLKFDDVLLLNNTKLRKYLSALTKDNTAEMFGALDPKAKETLEYACLDAVCTLRLGEMWPKAERWDIEMRYIEVLSGIERAGMGIDRVKLGNVYAKAKKTQDDVKSEWGCMFTEDIGSSAQLQSLFGSVWPTDKTSKTKGGAFSTSKDDMLKLMKICKPNSLGSRAVKLRLEYQDTLKIISTYTHSLIDAADDFQDRRIHPSYGHTGTQTGRLSCSNPNLQNVPAGRGDLGAEVKASFVPGEGNVFVSADYSQIELRVLAHFTGAGAMFEAYRNAEDVHQNTADAIGSTRSQGKTVNFAIIYGAGKFKLAQQIGTTAAKAGKFMSVHKKFHSHIYDLRRQVVELADAHGYVKTMSGRARYIPDLKGLGHIRYSGERKAFNTIIQGGAADIMKLATIGIYNRLGAGHMLISQVHDEMTLEVPEKDGEEVKHMMREVMEAQGKDLKVPLVAEPSIAKNWLECK